MKFSYALIKKLIPQAPTQKKLSEELNLHSFEVEEANGDLLDIKIPANQYSAMGSHIGIAREVSAIFNIPFKNPATKVYKSPIKKNLIKINIQEPKLCFRYVARVFDFNSIGDSSPEIKKILNTCGINSINAVVDIMNLVMLETGQPLHSFDASKLKGNINVRLAKKGEKMETLDKKLQELDPSILVIADDNSPLAIAGIKGGISSGVTYDTKRIIVEAASFDQVSIYKSSRLLKLQTDASARFSHGISEALVDIGINRATELLLQAGGKFIDEARAGNEKIYEEIIPFYPRDFEKLIGMPVDLSKAKYYFKILGFEINPSKKKGGIDVVIPAWRNDIQCEEDLCEEIIRFIGYDKLEKKAPVFAVQGVEEDDIFLLEDKVRKIFPTLSLDEVYNNSFYGDADIKNEKFNFLFGENSSNVQMINPSSEELKYLRKSLIPLLFEDYEKNAHNFESVRIFEIGKVFGLVSNKPKEKYSLGIFISAKKDNSLILELKGIVDELFKGIGIVDFDFVPEDGEIKVQIDDNLVGMLGTEKLKHGEICAFGEFDFEKMISETEEAREYIPIKKFPSTMRDVSVLVSKDIKIGDIIQRIQDTDINIIENVDLIDEYEDESLRGKQSLTFRIVFQADDRTLKDSEVNEEMDKILKILRSEFYAEIR